MPVKGGKMIGGRTALADHIRRAGRGLSGEIEAARCGKILDRRFKEMRRPMLLATIVAAMSFVIGACGGEATNTSTTTPNSATPSPVASPTASPSNGNTNKPDDKAKADSDDKKEADKADDKSKETKPAASPANK